MRPSLGRVIRTDAARGPIALQARSHVKPAMSATGAGFGLDPSHPGIRPLPRIFSCPGFSYSSATAPTKSHPVPATGACDPSTSSSAPCLDTAFIGRGLLHTRSMICGTAILAADCSAGHGMDSFRLIIVIGLMHRSLRIGIGRAFHGVPEDAVEHVLGTPVRFVQRPA